MIKPPIHWTSQTVGLTAQQPARVLRIAHDDDRNPRHDHDFWEIFLVESGNAIHETDMGAYHLKPRQAVILRPGTFHRLHTCRKLKLLNCVILPSVFENALAWMLEELAVAPMLYSPMTSTQYGPVNLKCTSQRMQRCMNLLTPIAQSPKASQAVASRANAVNRIATLISELAEQWYCEHPQTCLPASPVVQRTLQILTNQSTLPWQMDALAKKVNCSKAYLTRQFTAAMQISPMAFLAQCRAQQAAMLLRRTHRPIAKIAEATGYPNPEHFSRRFKDQFLITAIKYRQKHQHNPSESQ
jgi:AraC-like DNA-binding protein/mannose-6-phosphate isomerase-like protein (cupin superfamily)